MAKGGRNESIDGAEVTGSSSTHGTNGRLKGARFRMTSPSKTINPKRGHIHRRRFTIHHLGK